MHAHGIFVLVEDDLIYLCIARKIEIIVVTHGAVDVGCSTIASTASLEQLEI